MPASTYLVLRLPASPFPSTHDLLTSRISTPSHYRLVHPTPHSTTLLNSRSYTMFPSTPTFLKNNNTSSVQSTALGPAMASSMTFYMALAHLTSLVSFLPTAILPTLQSNTSNHPSLRLMNVTSTFAQHSYMPTLLQLHNSSDHLLPFHLTTLQAAVAAGALYHPMPAPLHNHTIAAAPSTILRKQAPWDYNPNLPTNSTLLSMVLAVLLLLTSSSSTSMMMAYECASPIYPSAATNPSPLRPRDGNTSPYTTLMLNLHWMPSL